MIRLRITFSKTSAMRFTSHLDLHKTWERTFRRAGLALAYGQGFNPHPRLHLACALPLGFTSDCELLDVWLNAEDIALEAIWADLKQTVPPGLVVHAVDKVDLHAPALQTQVRSVAYKVTLLEPVHDLETSLAGLLAVESLPRQRRGRLYDLRPLIEGLDIISPDEDAHTVLSMQLVAQEGRTGRPEEVLEALGLSPLAARIHRSKLILDPESILVDHISQLNG